MACQHSPDDKTLRLQGRAEEDDFNHLPSGPGRVACERQEDEEEGAVRPSLKYGANAWATAAKKHTNKLDKVQNISLRTILDAMKTTPLTEMEKAAGFEPHEGRRYAEKTKRMPDYPLHQKLIDPTKNRLKGKTLNHLINKNKK